MKHDEARGALFILKESLVDGNGLSSGYRKSLKKVISLVEEDPSLLEVLDEWNFIGKQFPHLLRDSGCKKDVLELGTKIIELPGSTFPSILMSKKGAFLFSELLYESLNTPTEIIRFCREAVRKSPMFMDLLYDCGFFILLNSIVSYDTAEFYSSVFAYKKQEEKSKRIRRTGDDVMYEIRRKYFDPEIVFGGDELVLLKDPPSIHTTAQHIHKTIFDELHNTIFYSLLELELEVNLHIMNYCTWDYLFICGSPDLRELIMNNNYLAVRSYRKMLESLERNTENAIHLSKIEDDDLMINVARSLEENEAHMVMECALVLYNYYRLFDWELDRKQFSEARIRKIFGLLEFGHSNCVCIAECLFRRSSSLGDASALSCLESCDTRKIVILLSKIYLCVDKEYFYKPSFLVLMTAWIDIFSEHKCQELPFLMEFLSDFVDFLWKTPSNFARIIFPFKKTKRSKIASDNNDVTFPLCVEEPNVPENTSLMCEYENKHELKGGNNTRIVDSDDSEFSIT